MHFKFKLWDIFENPKVQSTLAQSAFHFFQLRDEYEEKMAIDFITKHFSPLTKLYGAELNAGQFEERLLTSDLFQVSSTYVVLNAEKIPKTSHQFILDNWNKNSDHKLIFLFKQETELLKSFKKLSEFNFFQVELPAFYEFDRLLTYLLRKAGYHLDEDTINHILDLIPPETAKLWSFIQMIQVFFPVEKGLRKLSKSEIAPFLSPEKLDQFYYSTLLSQKNLYKFYRELSLQTFDIDIWRRTLPFLLSHLRKLLNPSYAKKKSKLSRYDKEIMACTKLWDEKSLLSEMRELSHLDLVAKIKPAELSHELRKRYLKEII